MDYYIEEVNNGCVMNKYLIHGKVSETLIFNSVYEAIEYIKRTHQTKKPKNNIVKKIFKGRSDENATIGNTGKIPEFTY